MDNSITEQLNQLIDRLNEFSVAITNRVSKTEETLATLQKRTDKIINSLETGDFLTNGATHDAD